MELNVEIRLLQEEDIHLVGELAVEKLDLGVRDLLIQLSLPLQYDVQVQMVGQDVVATGTLELPMNCECARCLKPFLHQLRIEHWICHIPLEKETHSVDLTPQMREDILLGFPQRPLCDIACNGLPTTDGQTAGQRGGPGENREKSAPWAELDKLTF